MLFRVRVPGRQGFMAVREQVDDNTAPKDRKQRKINIGVQQTFSYYPVRLPSYRWVSLIVKVSLAYLLQPIPQNPHDACAQRLILSVLLLSWLY